MLYKILWDFVSERREHWLEWTDDKGVTRIKRVTEEEYGEILSLTEDDDFLG